MPDFLSEVLQETVTETGQPGMMKPADIIALETHTAPATPPAAPTPAPATPPPAPATPPQQTPATPPAFPSLDIDALEAKVARGEALSGDEEAVLAIHLKQLEEAEGAGGGEGAGAGKQPEPKVYRVGGQEFSEAEMEAKAREHFQVGDKGLSEVTRQRMIETYYHALNKTEFSRSTAEQAKANARDREENARLREQNMLERARLAEQHRNVSTTLQRLEAKEKQFVAIASKTMTENDIYDEHGQIAPKKLAEFMQIEQARKELLSIQSDRTELERQQVENQQQALAAEVTGFIQEHPEYAPSASNGNFFEVYARFSKGETLDTEDEVKVQEVIRLVREARMNETSLDRQYAYNKRAGTLAIKGGAQAPAPGKPKFPLPAITKNKPRTARELIDEYKARIARNPNGAPGGIGGGERGGSPKSVARQTIENDKKVLGSAVDDFTRSIGY